MAEIDWRAVRDLFPVLRQWTYLNTATFGPMPTTAVAAAMKHFEQRDETASRDFLEWFDHLDVIRGKIARLIGADAADIGFCPNAGTGLSWLLEGVKWRSGDEVVAMENEFPNNLYAPALLSDRGVVLNEVSMESDSFDPRKFLDALSPRTRLVILSAVSYSSGLRMPLEILAPEFKRRGIITCVDATQSVGALRHDVSATPVDYLIVHGYKWMCSPTGAGFVYVSPETREWLVPSVISWRSHRDWRNVDQLHHGRPDLPGEAARYEGGVQNFSGLFAMEAVLDLLNELTPEVVELRVLELAGKCSEVLERRGGVLAAGESEYYKSPIVTAEFPGRDVSQLSETLERAKIAVAARKGRLRVSPHFFNSDADIEALAAALES
jgi:cysteine desulfurase/selenocysteine lyase